MTKQTNRRHFLKVVGTGTTVAALAGCLGSQNQDGGGGGGEATNTEGMSTESASKSNGEKTSWRFATAQEGGGSAQIGRAISVYFEQYSDKISIAPQTTQSYTQNMRLTANGQVELMMTHTILAHWAYNNLETFKENPVDPNRLPLQGHPTNQSINHFFIGRPNKGINTVSDLAGETVSVGPLGGSFAAIGKALLDAAGVLDDVNVVGLTFQEGVSAFRSGEIASMSTGIINNKTNSATLEIWQTEDVDIATMSNDQLDTLVNKYPYFSKAHVETTNHPLWPEVMTTKHDELEMPKIVGYSLLRHDLDHNLVYDSLKTIHENQEQIMDINEILWGFGWGEVELEGKTYDRWGIEGAIPDVPFHPGAAEYLKEIGYWNNSWKIAE